MKTYYEYIWKYNGVYGYGDGYKFGEQIVLLVDDSPIKSSQTRAKLRFGNLPIIDLEMFGGFQKSEYFLNENDAQLFLRCVKIQKIGK